MSGLRRWAPAASNDLLSRFVCCLGRLLDVQFCRGSVFEIKGAEAGAGGCFNNCGQTSL